MNETSPTVQLIMTVFGRWPKTDSCLSQVQAAAEVAKVRLNITIVDADSPDGTKHHLQTKYPHIEVVSASSDTYWAAGMRKAWLHVAESHYDYLLWLNNDVALDENSLADMFKLLAAEPSSVIVGTCRDPDTGSTTYSGFSRGQGLTRLRFKTVIPTGTPIRCAAPNGNVLLVDRQTDLMIGGFPSGYVHNLADLAYGMEAEKAGVDVWLTGAPIGTCSSNSVVGTWEDADLSIAQRIRRSTDIKAFPPRIYLRFCWKYAGVSGLYYFVRPYVRAILPERKLQ